MLKTINHGLQYLLLRVLFALLRLLPLRLTALVGHGLGTFLASLPTHVNRVARANIRLCLPSLTEAEVQKTHQHATISFVQTLFEMPKIYSLKGDAFFKAVEVEGLEHIRNDTSRLILTAHYGNWELVNKTLGFYGIPMAGIYRPANNKWVDGFITRLRAQESGVMIPKGVKGAKKLIKLVKDGMCAGFLNDQKMSDGIASTFFGQEVKSPSAIADLALKYQKDVVPVFVERTAWGRFKVTFYPPVELQKTGDNRKDSAHAIQKFNSIIEAQIRQNPSQWLWHHKRFKLNNL